MTGNNNPKGPQPAPVKWYYVDGGSAVGPVDAPGLRSAAQAGKLGMDTLVWRSGFDAWKRVDGRLRPVVSTSSRRWGMAYAVLT